MTLAITHTFVSVKTDGADATLIQPSHWNAVLTTSMATARILGRTTASSGAIEELNLADSATRTALGLGVLATLATITTTYLTDAAVTYAKIQNVSATSRLLGRSTAGAGVMEEISLGTGLELAAGVLSASSTVTPRGYIDGCVLSNDGSDATNDLDIAAGVCRDSTNAEDITLTALVKRLDATWVVGTNQGGLDTGTKATSTWYHVWAIKRVDTDVCDVLFSTSATAPTMPTDYTVKRRIGSFYNSSGNVITQFTQVGDDFTWKVSVADVSNSSDHTTAVTPTLSVPTGVVVEPVILVSVTGSGTGQGVLVSPISQTDTAPSLTTAPGVTLKCSSGGAQAWGPAQRVLTNTSAQIRYRASNSDVDTNIITQGWIDQRGRNA